MVPYSWRVPAPTLLCSGLGISRLSSYPGAVGGDKGSWKVVFHLIGPILARALHGAILISIHLSPFLTSEPCLGSTRGLGSRGL